MIRVASIAGIFVCVVSVVIAIVFWRFVFLPHPSEASTNQIGYWLVLHDMESQSPEIQRAMIDRIVLDSDKLLSDMSSSKEASGFGLSETQQTQLVKNLDFLKFTWFTDRILEYKTLAAEKKPAYLRDQIKTVESWATLIKNSPDLLASSEPAEDSTNPIGTESSADATTAGATFFFDDVESWIVRTSEENKSLAYSTVQDALVYWLSVSSLKDFELQTRIELALRLARELEAGAKAGDSSEVFQASQTDILKENMELLVQAWLIAQSQKLEELKEKSEQYEFVDAQIAKVKQWDLLEMLSSETSSGAGAQIQQLMAFNAKVESWIEILEPAVSQPLEKLIGLIKSRLLASAFQ